MPFKISLARPLLAGFLLAGFLLASGMGLAVAEPAPEERGQIRTFRNWIAGCDNARGCRAYGLPAEPSTTQLAIRLDRTGAADDAPRLTILFEQDAPVADGARLRITSDTGTRFDLVIGRGNRQEDGEITVEDRELTARLIAEMRRARSLRLTLVGRPANADNPDTISLDGAMAAFLWMDERQKRLGNRTALARPGVAPATSMPRPPEAPAEPARHPFTGPEAPAELPKPLLDAALDAWRALPPETCEDNEDLASDDVQIRRLSPGLLLVGLKCWSGAYNLSRIYFIAEEGDQPRIRPASFPRLREPAPDRERLPSEKEPDNILWNAEFTDEGGVAHLAKGRGPGDCGEIAEWQWNGTAFLPLRLEVMPTCRGLLPPNWFTLYRTR